MKVDMQVDLELTCGKCGNNIEIYDSDWNEVSLAPCEYCIREAVKAALEKVVKELNENV